MTLLYLLFIFEHVYDVQDSDFDDIFLVLLNQCLLYLYLLPKYYKLFVNGRAGELAPHHFEDGLEFIGQLRLLHEGIDDPEVDAVWEAVNALGDVHG